MAPNRQTLVTVGSDRGLRLWSLTPQGTKLKVLDRPTGSITAVAMSADSRYLVSGSTDSRVRLWDIDSGRLLRTFQEQSTSITAVAMSPDGKTIACGNQAGKLRWWNVHTGALLRTLTLNKGSVTAVTFGTQPHQIILASNDRQIQVWNLHTGQRDRVLTGHTAAIVGLQIVDQHTLISVGSDRTFVWNLEQQAPKPNQKAALNRIASSNHPTPPKKVTGHNQANLLPNPKRRVNHPITAKIAAPESIKMPQFSEV